MAGAFRKLVPYHPRGDRLEPTKLFPLSCGLMN